MDYDPSKYANTAYDALAPAKQLIDMIGKHCEKLPSDRSSELTIVDFGCGPGNTVQMLAERFPKAHVIGLDIDQAMIDYARAHCGGELANRCKFYVQNISAPWSEWCDSVKQSLTHQVDAIFSNYTLHWVDEPVLVAANVRQLLRPGGGIFVGNLLYCGDLVTVADSPEDRETVENLLNYPTEQQFISRWLFAFRDVGQFSDFCFHYGEPLSLYPEQYYKNNFINIPIRWYKKFALGVPEDGPDSVKLNEIIKKLILKQRVQRVITGDQSPGTNAESQIEIKQQLWVISLCSNI